MINTETLRDKIKIFIDNADDHVVKMVYALLKADSETDWWDELNEDEKTSIKKGIDDLENGRIISHEEVVKKHSQWLSK
ncbi:MAG: hypothetical protein ACR2FN_09000 [Chitinophagaceae bacterium]